MTGRDPTQMPPHGDRDVAAAWLVAALVVVGMLLPLADDVFDETPTDVERPAAEDPAP
jgi:hypothetical protein